MWLLETFKKFILKRFESRLNVYSRHLTRNAQLTSCKCNLSVFCDTTLRVRFETTTNTFGRFRSLASRGEAINFVDNDWCGECPIWPWSVHPRQMCNFRTCHWKGLKFPLSQYCNSILRQWHNAARDPL